MFLLSSRNHTQSSLEVAEMEEAVVVDSEVDPAEAVADMEAVVDLEEDMEVLEADPEVDTAVDPEEDTVENIN